MSDPDEERFRREWRASLVGNALRRQHGMGPMETLDAAKLCKAHRGFVEACHRSCVDPLRLLECMEAIP